MNHTVDSDPGNSSEDNTTELNGSCTLKTGFLEVDGEISDSTSFENEDTRSELNFDEFPETEEEKVKRLQIEIALANENTKLSQWQALAISSCGLVNDDMRRKVWPRLLEVDPNPSERAVLLTELSEHPEYKQVILDVNRSLKRFPPGIPYKQRVALQDQLTVLILRVIMKYPHLRYYQGYHDVAITFLLVVGEAVSFRIMERLSTEHLRECMEATMEKTSYRLNYIYPIIEKEHPLLYEFLERSTVGTMFVLPWYLTWFGHSLNQYRDVVRLYDFFLASPPLMPLYVAAALVLHRTAEIFEVGCDMASIHCLLSQIPDEIPFENILKKASELYKSSPPETIEKAVKDRIRKEAEQRKEEVNRIKRRNAKKQPVWKSVSRIIPRWLPVNYRNKYQLIFATATVLLGIYAYLRATDSSIPFLRWNQS